MQRTALGIALSLIWYAFTFSPTDAPSPRASHSALAEASTDDIARAGWLAGCWELRTAVRVTHEHWMSPSGGTMLGMSRTVVRDTLREFEYLRITMREGTLSYIASPSGQRETAFAAATLSDTLLVFENPAHDFPQRILYRRTAPDSVLARIEGTRNGQVRGIDFPMRRVGCAGS